MKTTFLLLAIFFCCGAVSFAQNVSIPDAAFKAALVGNPAINTNGDSEIQVSEASTYTGQIYVNGLGINDLTGIEAFTGIINLDCSVNHLTTLDLSNNIALQNISCYNNQLTNLVINNNIALTHLICYTNQLTNLDINNNVNLIYLNCQYNQLNSLDINNNINLITLYCHHNQLSSLDISNNIALEYLYCNNNQISSLTIPNNNILITLNCSYNQLSTFDFYNSNTIHDLDIRYNIISSSNIFNNTILQNFDCSHNQLTYLIVNNNPALVLFYCNNNSLSSLDVSNDTSLYSLYCRYNANLTCIQVFDTAQAKAHFGNININIDPTMYFSLDCNYTSTTENISSYFTFAPNPASDYLYIDSKNEKNVSYTISDIWGRNLEAWQDKKEVPISHLPAGIYFLTAQAGDKKVVKKFVKE